jgi:predicted nucleotidyltransferase
MARMAMPAPAQQDLIDAAMRALEGDPRVESVWLSGSLATGEGDEWSDVDLIAVTEEGALPGVLEDYGTDFSSIASAVHLFTLFGRIVSAVTADFGRIDILFLTPAELATRPPGGLRQLLARPGAAAPAGPMPAPRAAADAEVASLIREFLRVLGLAPVVVNRGDYIIGVDGAMLLRTMLVDLMLAEQGRSRSERSVKRVTRMLSAEQIGVLQALAPIAATRNSLLEAHRALAALFLPRAKALADQRKIAWPADFEAATRAHLKRALDLDLP